MRIEYTLELDRIDMPYFSIEASEGIHKLFTLAATTFNLLETKDAISVSIHGGSAQDPERKAQSFKEIIEGWSPKDRNYVFERIKSGAIDNTYYLWFVIRRA